jgi:hypothetical protein
MATRSMHILGVQMACVTRARVYILLVVVRRAVRPVVRVMQAASYRSVIPLRREVSVMVTPWSYRSH